MSKTSASRAPEPTPAGWVGRMLDAAVSRGLERLRTRPEPEPVAELHLELTHRCDQRCRMCHHWRLASGDPAGSGRELTLREIRRLAASPLLDGVRTVVLSGGEPLLRPDAAGIAGLLLERWPAATLGVLTNLQSPDAALRFLGETAGRFPGRVWLGSSLDGSGAAHDAVRGTPGAFERLMSAVAALRREFPRTALSLNFTATPGNHKELWGAYRLATGMGLWLGAQLVVDHKGAGAPAAHRWTRAQRAEVARQIGLIIDDIVARGEAFPRLVRGDPGCGGLWARLLYWRGLRDYALRPRRLLPSCPAGLRFVMLDPEGRLFFCPVRKHRTIGSVREAALDELWGSARARAERRAAASPACHCWLVCTAHPALERLAALGLEHAGK